MVKGMSGKGIYHGRTHTDDGSCSRLSRISIYNWSAAKDMGLSPERYVGGAVVALNLSPTLFKKNVVYTVTHRKSPTVSNRKIFYGHSP